MSAETKLRVTIVAVALATLAGVLMALQVNEPPPPSVAPSVVAVPPERAEPLPSSVPEASTGAREAVEAPAPVGKPAATANAAVATDDAGTEPEPTDRDLIGRVLLDTRAAAVGATVRIGRATTTSDATGRFTMPRQCLLDDDTLVATLAGYEAAVVVAVLQTPAYREGRDLEVVLPGLACGIDGWLVDGSGTPCEGWQIELYRGTECGDLGFPNLLAEDLAAGATTAAAEDRPQRSQPNATKNPNLQTVGADGVFRIGGLRRGHDYVLRAWNEHSLQTVFSAPVAAGSRGYMFTVDLAACRERVWGRVEDRFGVPIAGVRVRLSMLVHATSRTSSYATGQEIATAADGRFAFHQVPQQDLLLRCDGDGVEGVDRELRADEPGRDLKVQLSCRCRFRYEARPGAVAATELRMLDGDDKPLRMTMQLGPGRTTGDMSAPVTNGRSQEWQVSDAATWLQLRAGGEELARLPVSLDHKKTTVVR